jgi:cytidine deaminase
MFSGETIMTGLFSNATMDRRTALATLGFAGLGLLALQLTPAWADEATHDALSKLLPNLSEKSRSKLRSLLSDRAFSGQVPESVVKDLLDAEGKGVDELMLGLLPLARTYSHPPISNFLVGAVVRGASGALYFGANIEFPGQPLGFSVHAEQAALSNAYMHADSGVVAIAVTAAPCGHCRQFMYDLSPDGEMQILLAGKPTAKLSLLLPMAFGPKDLGFSDGAFPIKEVNMTLLKPSSDACVAAALEAARKSYARYSKSYSGVAIGTKRGRIYKGSTIENAAYNPSLPPLQTALAALLVAGEHYSEISKVVLVEADGATITQRSVTEIALAAIAPHVRLEVAKAKVQA